MHIILVLIVKVCKKKFLLKVVEMDIENKKQSIYGIDLSDTYSYIKRFFDVIFSVIGLVVLIIPFLIVALFIKRDDPEGSIFFKQERVGKNGQQFSMYKFRSMYCDAENKLDDLLEHNEIEGAMFKMINDPRITPIGKIIRKYSIDEFPQLFNVIKGEMSLVGPRPPLPREVEQYSSHDKQRLSITPGITGLWQVNGRNALSFQEMVDLDIKYIETVSLIMDVKILFKTITVVLKSTNAY